MISTVTFYSSPYKAKAISGRYSVNIKYIKIKLLYKLTSILIYIYLRLGDLNLMIRLQGMEEVKNGVRYVIFNRVLINFELNRARFRIMDQQNGDNVINQALNQFLNQNAKEIIEELKPAASVSISKVLKNFLNMAFSKVPLKVWMHDT